MAEEDLEEETNPNEYEVAPGDRTPSEWGKLRRTERAKNQAEARTAAVERELAFVKAGINTDDARMKYFVKGYEGEASTEAIRSAALEAGFLEAAPGMGEEATRLADAAQRGQALSEGAVPESGTAVDVAEQRLEAAFAEGGVSKLLDQALREGLTVG